MKNLLLIFSLLLTFSAFGQTDRTEVALVDEATFDINIRVQYNDGKSYDISFSRENNIDEIWVNNDCQKGSPNNGTLMADNYEYEQLLEYLQNIDIFTYQPSQNTQNLEANMRVQFSIIRNRTFSMNAFEIQHNPDIQGDEYQILEMISNVLRDNSLDSCSSEFAEKFERYVKGE